MIRPEAGHILVVGAGRPQFAAEWPKYYVARLREHGRWAVWWSFPLVRSDRRARSELTDALEHWPYLYVYFGAQYRKIVYRLHLIDRESRPGNSGIKSPWREFTDERERDVTMAEYNRSDQWYLPDEGTLPRIFKTWFLVDSFEELDPPISREELESMTGGAARPFRSAFNLWRLKMADRS